VWTTNQRSGHFIPMYMERYFQHFRSTPAMATVVTERKNGKRKNGNDKMERQNGNGMVETRHHAAKCVS